MQTDMGKDKQSHISGYFLIFNVFKCFSDSFPVRDKK